MILLDTAVLSELRKRQPSAQVTAWLSGLRDADLFLSVVSIGEIERGIRRCERQDPVFAESLTCWLENLLLGYCDHILPVTSVVGGRQALVLRRPWLIASRSGLGSTSGTLSPLPGPVGSFDPYRSFTHNDGKADIEESAMITETSAVAFRQNLGEMLDQVQHRHDSVVINQDGKPVAALIDAGLFERIRRMQNRFDSLCRRIEAGYASIPEAEGLAEIQAAVEMERAQARASAKPR